MGALFSSPPKPPKPIPPTSPLTPEKQDEATQAAKAEAARRRSKATGFASTILTKMADKSMSSTLGS